MTSNNVTYTYGTSGIATGRPLRIEDGSGVYECSYDALGRVTDTDDTLQSKAQALFDQSLAQVNSRELNENSLECVIGNGLAVEEFSHRIQDIPRHMQAAAVCEHSQIQSMVNALQADPSQGQEREVYFYHSDHLGSASWITDSSGTPIQHLQYCPYGEPYINQRLSGYTERFTFTGKERDEETDYHYFGARYLDANWMTGWLSVDPMADKYPSISPYAYCALNPVKLVDPNGDTLDVINNKGQSLFSLDDSKQGRSSITAMDLYNKGVQWSEPNADNYMPLLYVNKDIESIDGIAHFSWDQIEEFALVDRFMVSYRKGGSGDFKNGKEFLCTVDGIPYWTDIIGQIPLAINCYKIQLMNGKTHQEAASYTQKIGHLFASVFFTLDDNPNDADNWMIKRVCDWASKGFDIGGYQRCGRYVYSEVRRTSYNFNKLAQWKHTILP